MASTLNNIAPESGPALLGSNCKPTAFTAVLRCLHGWGVHWDAERQTQSHAAVLWAATRILNVCLCAALSAFMQASPCTQHFLQYAWSSSTVRISCCVLTWLVWSTAEESGSQQRQHRSMMQTQHELWIQSSKQMRQFKATERTTARHHLSWRYDQEEVHGSSPFSKTRLSVTLCENQTEDSAMLNRQTLTDTTIALATSP